MRPFPTLLLFLAPALAQQPPRLDGFPFQDGAARSRDAQADDHVAVIGTDFGERFGLRAFVDEVVCTILAVRDVGEGRQEALVALPADLERRRYTLTLESAGGTSNGLTLKIVALDALPDQVGEGRGQPEPRRFLILGEAIVEERDGRLTVVCPGTSRFPARTTITGELEFFGDVIRRSSFLVQADQSFLIELAMEPGVALRPGSYRISAHFNLRAQGRRQTAAITRALGEDASAYGYISASTLVSHDEAGKAAEDHRDREHYAAMCDRLERASARLYDAYAAAARIHGQTDAGYVEDAWWSYLRRSTECLPRGLPAEERAAMRKKWAADDRFTRGRSAVRLDVEAWRAWLDEDFRGAELPGLRALADEHAAQLGRFRFPAHPASAALIHDAIALLLVRSAELSLALYRHAGEPIDPNDQRGRLMSSFEGQGSDTSREAFAQLLRRVRRKLRIGE